MGRRLWRTATLMYWTDVFYNYVEVEEAAEVFTRVWMVMCQLQ